MVSILLQSWARIGTVQMPFLMHLQIFSILKRKGAEGAIIWPFCWVGESDVFPHSLPHGEGLGAEGTCEGSFTKVDPLDVLLKLAFLIIGFLTAIALFWPARWTGEKMFNGMWTWFSLSVISNVEKVMYCSTMHFSNKPKISELHSP